MGHECLVVKYIVLYIYSTSMRNLLLMNFIHWVFIAIHRCSGQYFISMFQYFPKVGGPLKSSAKH